MTVALDIGNRTRREIDARWLSRHLRKLLNLQRVRTGSWSITIVGDREMAELHKRTMSDPTTTDVLTFDLRDDSTPRTLDLDTVVCADVAARQAKQLGHSLNHELLLDALHSLLHVRGYDDLTPADFERMHRREDALLIASGLEPLYRPRSFGQGHKIKNQKSKIKNTL